jgi:hypothetical protein
MGRGLDGFFYSAPKGVGDARYCGCYAVLKDREGWSLTFSGGFGEGETPLPIPNRAVKPLSADGTWPARAWESRTPPVYLERTSRPQGGSSSFWPITARRRGRGGSDERSRSRPTGPPRAWLRPLASRRGASRDGRVAAERATRPIRSCVIGHDRLRATQCSWPGSRATCSVALRRVRRASCARLPRRPVKRPEAFAYPALSAAAGGRVRRRDS